MGSEMCIRDRLISTETKKCRLKITNTEIYKVDAPQILIAGAGTGQQSLYASSRFEGSNILAVDLSLSSLSYAKRKTEELGVTNIEYMQADILDLEKLNMKFDMIECSGVLHHMEEPLAGWRVLVNCLKTGGLMKIGLYSERARTDIVDIHKEIDQSNIGPVSYKHLTLPTNREV